MKLYIAFETHQLAQDFERYLKSGSGHAFANRHFWNWRLVAGGMRTVRSDLRGRTIMRRRGSMRVDAVN